MIRKFSGLFIAAFLLALFSPSTPVLTLDLPQATVALPPSGAPQSGDAVMLIRGGTPLRWDPTLNPLGMATNASNALPGARVNLGAASFPAGNPGDIQYKVGSDSFGSITLDTFQLLQGLGSGNPPIAVNVNGDITLTGAGTLNVAPHTINNTKLATALSNTIKGNSTNVTASPTDMSMPGCSTAGSALKYTTNTGVGCNSAIDAATLLSKTWDAPGPIGNGTPSTFNGVTITPGSGTLTIVNGKILTDTSSVGAVLLKGATGGGFAAAVAADIVAAGGAPSANPTFTGTATMATVVPTGYIVSGTTKTVDGTDCGKTIHFTSATPVTVTYPNNIITECTITNIQEGAGPLTFAAAAGATIHNVDGYTKTAGQWAIVDVTWNNNAGGTSAVYTSSGRGA